MESFLDLLKDPAHWYFEIFLIILFDGIIGALIWPWIQGRLNHHKQDDEKLEILWNNYKSNH